MFFFSCTRMFRIKILLDVIFYQDSRIEYSYSIFVFVLRSLLKFFFFFYKFRDDFQGDLVVGYLSWISEYPWTFRQFIGYFQGVTQSHIQLSRIDSNKQIRSSNSPNCLRHDCCSVRATAVLLINVFFCIFKECFLLKDIVKSVFCENNNDPSIFPALVLPEEISLMKNIRATMTERALVNHKPFEDQIMKLYQVSRINQG